MGVLRNPVVLKRGGRTVKVVTPSEITAYKAAGFSVVDDAPKPAGKPATKKN